MLRLAAYLFSMKRLYILIIGVLLALFAPIFISAQEEEIRLSMEDGLRQLEERFDCSFLYEADVIKGQTVAQNTLVDYWTIKQTLETIEQRTSLKFKEIEDRFWVVQPSHPYGRIQGFVYDEQGLPLVGASVFDPKSKRGVATDINGFYDLWIPAGEVYLKFSYIGFQTEEITTWLPFGQKIKLDNTLSESIDLAEIIVWSGTTVSLSTITPTAFTQRVTEEEMTPIAASDIGQLLQFSAPSFHATYQTNSDGTDHIDPASLRGLGPDQMLVLVNGKRRHHSALVNVNSTVGRGSVSTDLNTIPLSAIKSVEILADGATAQYGADAIAGVVNLVLKDSQSNNEIKVFSGITQQGDGLRVGLAGYHSITKKDNGFLDLSWRIDNRSSVNRSGDYQGPVYGDHRDDSVFYLDQFYAQNAFSNKRVMLVGSAAIQNYGLHFNQEHLSENKLRFYQFGGVNLRYGQSAGFYRFPYQRRKQSGLYEWGFSPQIKPRIIDYAWVIGLGKQWKQWKLDISQNLGLNSVDFFIENSNNASMGLDSPTSAHAGKLRYGQIIWQLDALRRNEEKTATWRMGFSWRNEVYHQMVGDEWSWQNYGSTTLSEEPREAGIQVFPGFRPTNTTRAWRPSGAAYFGLDYKVNEKWMPSAAIRWEYWPENGHHLLGKLSLKYQPVETVQFRLAANTAMRSASLPQRYFSSQTLQFVPEGNKLVGRQIAQLNGDHPLVSHLGIAALHPEQSYNFSIGGQWKYQKKMILNASVYHINIQNRIILGSRLNQHDSPVLEQALADTDFAAIQFFTNALHTINKGVDIGASHFWAWNDNEFRLRLASSINQTKVMEVKLSEQLEMLTSTVFNREDEARLEKAQPASKLITQLQWKHKRWNASVQATRFGEVTYWHPNDGKEENWVLNEFSNTIESRDQLFTAKWLTDLSCHLQLSERCALGLYGRNVFNIYPDKHQHSPNTNDGIFVYSRYVQQFGVWGANYMLEFEMNL